MKREIKFRAWHELNKEMIYPYARGFNNILSNGDLLNRFENIMQYTGLKDKNGKEIYEGDILKCVDSIMPYINHIQYTTNGFWLVNPFGQEHLPSEIHREVIGNIYENPELLK